MRSHIKIQVFLNLFYFENEFRELHVHYCHKGMPLMSDPNDPQWLLLNHNPFRVPIQLFLAPNLRHLKIHLRYLML